MQLLRVPITIRTSDTMSTYFDILTMRWYSLVIIMYQVVVTIHIMIDITYRETKSIL